MVAEGPCDNSAQSQQQLTIHFTACDSCPIGFEKHTDLDEDTSCQCVCDSQLKPYITKCNASTELLERDGDFWINYVNGSDNATSGYLLYAHCPLNYCKPPSTKVEINLNIPGGADVQCADGHSGTLCGSCQSNLSLSLGSSRSGVSLVRQTEPLSIVTFSGNSADYGGAVYVSDDSNSDTCNPSFTSHYKARECVMQVLAIYSSASLYVNQMRRNVNPQNIYFSQNHANTSGSSLFGGLLDRCKLHHSSELQDVTNHTTVPRGESRNLKIVNGISYLTNISIINMSEISSEPVQLCFCKPNGVDTDCDYQPDPVRVIKGKRFSIKVAAVDEVGHLISTRINSRLRSTGGGFGSGQEFQNTSKTCTELNFNLFSPNDKEELIMVVQMKGICCSTQTFQNHGT